jgi:RNA polymerase sigma-70 factor (ECF subfamily)
MTHTPIDRAAEHRLLVAARAGNEQAFGRLVERHRPGLELYCHLMLGCPLEAKNVMQETVLRAWRGRGSPEADASARTWLYRIATQACLDSPDRHR